MKAEKYNNPVVKNIKAIIAKKGLKKKTVAEAAGFKEKD